jgi:hypothetical protein
LPASATALTLAVAAATLPLGCRPAEEKAPVESAPIVVGNIGLDLRLAGLPSRFVVERNSDRQLTLKPADPEVHGTVSIAVLPPEAGQNLPAMVSDHQTDIETREDGDALGGQELISPLGTTFYSRGRFTDDGSVIEEVVVFALHPRGDRAMTVTYHYPAADDSGDRVQQLLEIVAVVEGM